MTESGERPLADFHANLCCREALLFKHPVGMGIQPAPHEGCGVQVSAPGGAIQFDLRSNTESVLSRSRSATGHIWRRRRICNIPEVIIEAIRLRQVTALRKLDGGVRGIVIGDIVCRLVARTMAKGGKSYCSLPVRPDN